MKIEIDINDKLFEDINSYVTLNAIENINAFIVEMIVKGFNIEKYGNNPFEIISRQKKEKVKKISSVKKNVKSDIEKENDIPITDKTIEKEENKDDNIPTVVEKKKKVRVIKKD